MGIKGVGSEWDEGLLAASVSETGSGNVNRLDWQTVMIGGAIVIVLLIFVMLIIRQYHLYEVFAGRKV